MFWRVSRRCGAISALLLTGILGTAPAQNPFAADDQAWRSALEEGVEHQRQGHPAQAEASLVRALRLAEAFGPSDARLAACLNALAIFYHSQKTYSAAEPLYLRALEALEASVGADHPAAGRVWSSLADLYLALGRAEQAEGAARRRLDVVEASEEFDAPQVEQALTTLSLTLFMQRRFDEAELHVTRALQARRSREGESSIEYAQGLSDLGAVYVAAGRHHRGDQTLSAALRLREEIGGATQSPAYARDLANLAEASAARTQYAEAERLLETAIAVRARSAPEGPETAAALNNLGEILRSQGAFEAAEARFRESVRVWIAAGGASHVETAAALYNLARSLEDQNKLVEARDSMSRSLDAFVRELGREHPRSIAVADHLSALLRRAGDVAAVERSGAERD